MEEFKIDIFRTEHKNIEFPPFKKIGNKKSEFFKMKFAERCGLPLPESESLKILKLIREKSQFLSEPNAKAKNFHFISLLDKLKIPSPDNVNINWDRFENIDKFKFTDFCKYFEYIWYPGPDEIEIFPDDVLWIISIDASGDISIIK